MRIVDFTLDHMTAAELLAKENYREERQIVSCLPEPGEWPGLRELADNGLGVAAVQDDGTLLGFWGCAGPWEKEYGSEARGGKIGRAFIVECINSWRENWRRKELRIIPSRCMPMTRRLCQDYLPMGLGCAVWMLSDPWRVSAFPAGAV